MLKRFRLQFLPVVFCAMSAFLLILISPPALALPAPVSVLLQINRIAGSPSGASGFLGDSGPAMTALLSQPESVTVDGAGNLYIADTSNNRVRRIDALTGIISTVAGNGQQGYSGDNGPAIGAALNQPGAVLADAHGDLYIADTGNGVVRFVNLATGNITLLAGTPNITPFNPAKLGDGGPPLQAELQAPSALALDMAGDLYIADAENNRVREISQTTGIISTVAGTGDAAYAGDGGIAALASLNQPTGVGVDAAGNLYIADSGNNIIRKVDVTTGIINTVAGVPGTASFNNDGLATDTDLNFPTGIAVDMAGQVYFSDRLNNRIRQLNLAGNVVTLAGNGTAGIIGDGQLASSSEVSAPGGLTVDPDGNLYFADSANNDLRLISNGLGFPATPIAATSPLPHMIFLGINQAATLTNPAATAAENDLQEFTSLAVTGCVTDGSTSNAQGSVCTVPVNFVPGYPGERTATLALTANGTPVSFGLHGLGLGPETTMVPGVISTSIPLGLVVSGGKPMTAPGQIAIDAAGNVYVADPGTNQVIRQDVATAALSIIAGGGQLGPAQADGGLATDAALNGPAALAIDAAGNLYVAEAGANRVRAVNLATGIITTVAGDGIANYAGDNGPAVSSELNGPSGIAANAAGDLFIADTGNNRIRRIYASTGMITTVVGNGTTGFSGDEGPAILAELSAPRGVAVDAANHIYIADTGNSAVRAIDPMTGYIVPFAGNGTAGFSGDLGAATSAQLKNPAAIALDAAGDLYIADTGNARVRKVYAQSGAIVTIAGSALIGDAGDSNSATAAALTSPSGVALDSIGQIVIADQGNDTVRTVSTDADFLNFNDAGVGSTTAAKTDFLANIGNQTLAISNFSAPVDFPAAVDPAECAVGNLAAGSLCDLSFVFHPTVPGLLTEDAWITDNALNVSNAQQNLTLTGNGTVNPTIATITTVTVTPTMAIYGTPVVLTATVTGGNGPVNGNVSFDINGFEIRGAALTGAGSVSITLPAAPTGTDVVTASFAEQNGFGASVSAPVTLTVTPANTQITLTASAQQIRLGQNVIFTANVVSATTGVPTGSVEFLNGTTELGEALVGPTGQAIFNSQNLPAGTDTITAQYLGDANFQQSTSGAVTVTVADDTLTLVAAPTQLIIAPGKTGQTIVTLTPKNGFASVVNLSCAGLVQGATCQFSTTTETFTAQAQTAQTVTLTITPNTIAPAGFSITRGGSPLLRLLLLLLGLGAAFLLFRARRRSAFLMLGRALIVVFCLGICALTGCGNLVPQQPLQASVSVQASMPSGGVIASAQLQVSMQR